MRYDVHDHHIKGLGQRSIIRQLHRAWRVEHSIGLFNIGSSSSFIKGGGLREPRRRAFTTPSCVQIVC